MIEFAWPGRLRHRTVIALAGLALAAAGVAAGQLAPTSTAPTAKVDSSTSITGGGACAGPASYQVPSGQSITVQLCTAGLDGSTINPTPYVDVIAAPDPFTGGGFQGACRLEIQLTDSSGNTVSDTTTGCEKGIESGAMYAYNGIGSDNSPGTAAFTAHATLTYRENAIDLGTSPAYTAGLRKCANADNNNISMGGDPATLSFSAGQLVVIEFDSTDIVGTSVAAALGTDLNRGSQATSGISTSSRPFYAQFGQFGTEPFGWTVSVGSTLGADIPADAGPAGSGVLGGAGTVAWFVYSDYCG